MKLAGLLALAVVMAGCSDPSSTAPEAPDTGIQGPTATTGIIHGVVVDDAITPIEGAQVVLVNLNLKTTSNDNGEFGFDALDPGAYLVEVIKLGYDKVQSEVQVEAAVEPTSLRVQLPRRAGFDPYVSALQWDGLLVCSWNVATLFLTGCGLGEQLEDQSRQFDTINPRGEWLQSEMVWEHSQPLGENLCMRHYASSGVGGDVIGDACGTSPQMLSMDQPAIEQTGIGNTRGLERIVWVDHWAPDTAGIALDQRFTVFTHVFHNHVPEAGWRFTVDGDV